MKLWGSLQKRLISRVWKLSKSLERVIKPPNIQQCFTIKLFLFLDLKNDPLVFIRRRVWRGVQWKPKAPRKEGDVCGHQNTEVWLHREAEARLSEWSEHHGAVWSPQCHPFGGSGDQEQPRHDHHRVYGEWLIGLLSQGEDFLMQTIYYLIESSDKWMFI